MDCSAWWTRGSQLEFMTLISLLGRESLRWNQCSFSFCHCFPRPTGQIQVGQKKVWTVVMVSSPLATHSREAVCMDCDVCKRQRWPVKPCGVSTLLGSDAWVPPTFLWWNCHPQGDGSRRRGLWEVFGHKGKPLMTGIHALIRRGPRELPCPFGPGMTSLWKAALTRHGICRYLDLEHPKLQTMRNKFLWFMVGFCFFFW